MKKRAPKRPPKTAGPARKTSRKPSASKSAASKSTAKPSGKTRKPYKLKTLSPLESPSVALDPEIPVKPSAPIQDVPSNFELPAHYGDNKIVLLVRDPWWIYAYWEVQPDAERRVVEEIERKGLQRGRTTLRVYDVTGASVDRPRSWFDIEVTFLISNWYIDVGIPDRDWVVELGIRASNGAFFPIVRSNVVRTPRFGVSEEVDEEWMCPDDVYWKLFGLSGGLADRRSSLDVRDILEKYLKSIVSSAGISSFSQSIQMIRNESRVDVNAKILERP
jgi:hypothetical protein